MSRRIRLGISTCPNDTFAFHAILKGLVDCRGIEFDIQLLDIQQLNEQLFASKFDVAKASFHAAILLADQTWVLPSGSALGFGVGPLLLAAHQGSRPEGPAQVTLCPGEHTTAALLFQLFYPSTTQVRQVVFSDIMPMLSQGQADFGVCIHEGRFTWQEQGLGLVEDLGTRWETQTRCPLPLGGIVAARTLPLSLVLDVQAVIYDSLLYARADPGAAFPTMREYAQELNDDVLMQHVDLYVNDWTLDLGAIGRQALDELCRRAQAIGISCGKGTALQVLEMA